MDVLQINHEIVCVYSCKNCFMLDGLMEEDGGPRVRGVHVFECTGARLLVLNAVLRG